MNHFKLKFFCCLMTIGCLLLFASAALAQSDTICGIEITTGFDAAVLKSNKDAKKILNEVVKAAGVNRNAIEIRAANVDNARACENKDDDGNFKRYILYNPKWLNDLITEVGTEWTARAILAHEVGHHKKAHNLYQLDGESCSAKFELEADEVAGEALAKLKATLEEAQAAFEKISDDESDECYPSRSERLAAVKKGWEKINPPKKPPTKPKKKTEIIEQLPPPAYAIRCAFPLEPNIAYFINSNDDIIGIPQNGLPAVQVGKKISPTVQGFAWMYSTQVITYGVDGMGRVWSRDPYGNPVQVGSCYKL